MYSYRDARDNERGREMELAAALILKKVSEGMDILEAFDAVIGKGAAEKLAHEVWAGLRAK